MEHVRSTSTYFCIGNYVSKVCYETKNPLHQCCQSQLYLDPCGKIKKSQYTSASSYEIIFALRPDRRHEYDFLFDPELDYSYIYLKVYAVYLDDQVTVPHFKQMIGQGFCDAMTSIEIARSINSKTLLYTSKYTVKCSTVVQVLQFTGISRHTHTLILYYLYILIREGGTDHFK